LSKLVILSLGYLFSQYFMKFEPMKPAPPVTRIFMLFMFMLIKGPILFKMVLQNKDKVKRILKRTATSTILDSILSL
jgi:hypothetical protein